MNESENLRIIKELEKDIQAGNLDGLMSKLAEDVVWNIPGPSLYPFAGCYRGHEQIKNVFALAVNLTESLSRYCSVMVSKFTSK